MSSGKMCAVVGCHNCSTKLTRWKDIICTEHNEPHKDCPCLQPFSLHRFPRDETVRLQWVQATNRKDFIPTENSVICSKHFVEGRPTKINRIPQIEMGYERKVLVGRRTIKRHAIPLLNKKTEVAASPSQTPPGDQTPGSEEVPAFAEANVVAQEIIAETSKTFCSVGTQWEDFSLQDHNYFAKVSATQDKGSQCNFPDYSYKSLSTSDSVFYTGLQLGVFTSLVNILASVGTPKYRMAVGDQILLVLMRLRLGLLFADLGRRFKISTSLANNIFNYWLPVMAKTLSDLVFWLPRETIRDKMPQSFKELYPQTTCIIDCSEVFIQRPAKLRARAQTFSNYKAHNTAKFLIGIAPHGYVMFISRCYGGRASDRLIVHDSGFMKMLIPGDEVMADRGFTIEAELKAQRVGLNIPAFTRGQKQLPEEEVTRTRRVASVRIHVERSIARIKQYRILKFTLNAKGASTGVDNLVMVCAALTNLHSPLIQEKTKE